MFANCQLKGKDLAFPDVCRTPAAAMIPLPYPNIALGPMAIPNACNILFAGAPAHNMATIIPMTMGDEAGSGGGVVSQTFMCKSRHVTGAYTCLVRGTPVTRLTSQTTQNLCNAAGGRVCPSQCKVLILAP